MKNWIAAFLIIVLGGLLAGCQQTGELPDVLKVTSRSPEIDASGVAPNQTLTLAFNFQVNYGGMTKENFLTEYADYGDSHTAGTPNITSLLWSEDGKTLTLEISGWSAVSASSAQAANNNAVVHIVPRAGKIKDVFDNVISAVLWKYYLNRAVTTTTTTTTTTLPQAAAPTFSPAEGYYGADALAVTIESATSGAEIYYTLDGSTPDTSTLTHGPSPVTVNLAVSKTIRAMAAASGYSNSPVSSSSYDVAWWWPGLDGGTNSTVYALALGSLYATGAFNQAGGVAVDQVAKWDGTSWSAMGGGFAGGPLAAVTVDSNSNVYIAGDFSIPAKHIGMWTGSTWETVGGGTGGTAFALTSDNSGNIYVGGQLMQVGGVTTNHVAKWDGSTWEALGSGTVGVGPAISSAVNALVFDNASGILYVGGSFTTAGGSPANYVAMWDSNTNTWSNLGDGFDNTVLALAYDPTTSTLYAGGQFTTSGATPVSYIAKWDGSSWSAIGDGFNNRVYALAVDSYGNLFAGGTFTASGATSLSRIARWNGSSWSPLGNGVSLSVPGVVEVDALEFDGSGNLYVGGTFDTVDSMNANFIAIWRRK